MKGLLLKDLYMSVNYLRAFLLIILVFLGISLFGDDNLFFVLYPIIFASMIPVSLISYEEHEKWTSYCGVLPYSRVQIVTAKYLIGLIFNGIVFVLSLTVQAARMIINHSFSFENLAALALVFLLIGLIIPTLLLPFIFCFGPEKGRIAFYVMIGLCGAAIGVLISMNFSLPAALPHGIWILIALCAGVILLYGASWRLSVFFYNRKEL